MRGRRPNGTLSKPELDRMMRLAGMPFGWMVGKRSSKKSYPLLVPLPGEPGWDRWHKANVKRARKNATRATQTAS